MPDLRLRLRRYGRRFEVIHGVHADGPTTCPTLRRPRSARRSPPPTIHFKGSGWAKKDRRASAATKAAAKARARQAPRADGSDGQDRSAGVRSGPDRATAPAPKEPGLRSEATVEVERRHDGAGSSSASSSTRSRTDHGRRRPTGSPSPRRPTSSPPRTSISRRRRSAAGLGRAGSRASSSAAAGSSGAARSGRSSRPRAGSGPRMSSRSCSRTSVADPGRQMRPAGDPRTRPRPAPGGAGHARSSTSTAVPPAACSRTDSRSRRCSPRSRPTLLVLGVAGLIVTTNRPGSGSLVLALSRRSRR